MTNDNNKIEENTEIDPRVHDLLQHFTGEDLKYAKEIVSEVDVDGLSPESLQLLIKELKAHGSLFSSLVVASREAYDLREKLRKERLFTIIGAIGITACVLIIGFLLYLFTVFPKYKVVQTIDNSVICEIKPANNPMLTEVAIQDFARQAVLSAYSFSYINYRDEIGNATTRYFTSEGRAAFNRALRVSGSLNHIITNNLIMKTSATSVAQIEEKGLDNKGRQYWVVRMPIMTEFFTGSDKPADTQHFIAQVRITTTDRDAFNPKGLGVYSLTLRPHRQGR